MVLAASSGQGPSGGLAITLGRPLPDVPSEIGLNSLLAFRGGRLVLNRLALDAALARRFGDDRIACEILFERGDVILVNHVTGLRRTLASPNLDSWNDNAFVVLHGHSGETFTRPALMTAVQSEGPSPDLHKLAANLNFDGVLKKLFFRISKNAIRFDRAVTVGQLAALGIDASDVR